MGNSNKNFNFTYSAKEQEEVKRIRHKYQPQEIDKLELLRSMDANVTKKATVVSLILGIFGTLIMGSGMSLAMTNIGVSLGMEVGVSITAGIVIGIIGIAILSCAYPVYNHIIRVERKKIAPEIIKITDELMI